MDPVPAIAVGGVHNERLQDTALLDVFGEFGNGLVRELGAWVVRIFVAPAPRTSQDARLSSQVVSFFSLGRPSTMRVGCSPKWLAALRRTVPMERQQQLPVAAAAGPATRYPRRARLPPGRVDLR